MGALFAPRFLEPTRVSARAKALCSRLGLFLARRPLDLPRTGSPGLRDGWLRFWSVLMRRRHDGSSEATLLGFPSMTCTLRPRLAGSTGAHPCPASSHSFFAQRRVDVAPTQAENPVVNAQ